MRKRVAHTIGTLLEELKKDIPNFRNGQIFEILKSIYPDTKIPKEKRNVTYNNISFTKPLACDRKTKAKYSKEKSPVADFFKDTTRGDFLKIVETNGYSAKCINLSLKDSIREKFYRNEIVEINFNMVARGDIKQFRRKVSKYLTS